MTTAIALETSKGDVPLALALGAVLLSVVLVLHLLLAALTRRVTNSAVTVPTGAWS